MNLFGVNISLGRNGNGKFIKQEDCHAAQHEIKEHFNQRIEDLAKHIDRRLDDFKDFLLKNGN